MKLLLVTFSLRNLNKDYNSFFVTVRGNVYNWWHFIEQTIVVSTSFDAESFAHLLYPHLETTDSLLVVEIQPHQFQGWLPKAAWDWLWNTSWKIAEEKKLLSSETVPSVLPPPPKQTPNH